MARDEFVSLHTHSDSSAFDGLGKAKEFFKQAAELGQSAIAMTEHGSIRGFYEAAMASKETGVKFIPGVELYLADDASRKGLTDDEKDEVRSIAKRDGVDEKERLKAAEASRRDRDHVTVWAETPEGVRSLYKLTAWAWGPGFYYKPRVDLKRLVEFGDGLLVSSGCPTGIISSPLRAGKVAEALDRAEFLASHFGDRFYVEIMPHLIEGGENLPHKLARIASRFGATVIATQDAHYPCACDSVAHDVFLCVQTADVLSNPDRFKFGTREFYLKTRAGMREAFERSFPTLSPSIVEGALDETVAFADRVSAVVPLAKPGTFLVAPELPPGIRGYDDWVLRLCRDGARDRFGVARLGDLPEVYRDRLAHELRTISDLGFSSYFVLAWDLRKWAKGAGIPSGPGRGSAAGALVCYLLRITDLDPIRFGLMFERFLPPGRKDLPDVDLDFSRDRRDEVLDYLREKYGDDRVAHISTRNELGGKSTLRDLARIYEIPERDIAPVSSLIVNAVSEEEQSETTLAETLKGTEAGRQFASRYPDVANVAERLEGNLRGVGIHASGIVVSSVPVIDVAPVETQARRGGPRVPVLAFDMKGAEAAGLVKVDVLGLKTLDLLDVAAKISGVSWEGIDLEDGEILDAFTAQRFIGVFQFDSPSARKACRGFTFRRFSDVAIITSIDRPGPMKTGLATQFVDCSNDRTKIVSLHPIYDEVFAETYGVPVYQEQVVRLVRDLCGYSPEAADGFRKKLAKKIGLSDEIEPFLNGAIAAGMDEDRANKLFKGLVGFGSYAFNKSHATCYAALAVATMFYKVRYPEAFVTAALATEDKAEKQLRIATEARRLGIRVSPPDVNLSGGRFTLAKDADGSVVVGSIGDLKGIGPETADAISAAKPFASLGDFYKRTAGAGVKVTSRTFDILARATALRSLCPGVPTKVLVTNSREIWEGLKKGREPIFDEGIRAVPDYDSEEANLIATDVYPLFVDLSGRGTFDATFEKLREKLVRPILLPGDLDLEETGFALIAGRLSTVKTFGGADGKTARIGLTAPDGSEITLRVDADVLDRSAGVLSSTGKPVVAAVAVAAANARFPASVSLEWIGDAVALLGKPRDRIERAIAAPWKTRPRNPEVVLRSANEGEVFGVEGIVLRARLMTDKNGQKMKRVSILGEKGAIRFFVFASRMGEDAKKLKVGEVVSCRLEKLSGDGACLSDSEVRPGDEPDTDRGRT